MPARRQPITDRFWRYTNRLGADDCWEWTASRFRFGYGRLNIAGKSTPAHRVSWMIHHGPIPQGLVVCHRCDNPPCVNPAHLFLGTESDNQRDMHQKGRAPERHGENSPLAKLTTAQVAEIRHRVAAGQRQRAIAAEFGVSQTSVSFIANGHRWSKVIESLMAEPVQAS